MSEKKNDGIYFSPPAPAETVQLAASLAAGLLVMPPLEMKYINLQQEWHRTYGHLERIQSLAPCPKKWSKRSPISSTLPAAQSPQAVVAFCPSKRKLTKRLAHIGQDQPTTKKIRNALTYTSKDKHIALHHGTCKTTLNDYFCKKRVFDLTT